MCGLRTAPEKNHTRGDGAGRARRRRKRERERTRSGDVNIDPRRSTSRGGDKQPFVTEAGAALSDRTVGKGVDGYGEKRLDAILDGAAIEEAPEEEEVRPEEKGLVICDVPGLVEDASEGVGLGDAFLKHVERCACLLHVVDASLPDPCKDYATISKELSTYSETLANKPRVVLLNKIDALDASSESSLVKQLRTVCGHARIATASALSGKGVDPLMEKLQEFVKKQSQDYAAVGERVDLDPPFANSPDADRSFTIKDGAEDGFENQWRVDSPRLEKIAAMTKFDQPDAVARFGRIVEALGISDELEALGAVPGDLVMIGDDMDLEYDPVGGWVAFSELKRAAEEEEGGDDVDDYEGEVLEFSGEDMDDFAEESYADEDFMFLLDGDA